MRRGVLGAAQMDGVMGRCGRSGTSAGMRSSGARGSYVDRIALHRRAVAAVCRHLQQQGYAVTRISAGGSRLGDLLVGRQRVAVRVGRLIWRRHRVRVNGRRYVYRYQVASFNLGAHGRLAQPDYFVLLSGTTAEQLRNAIILPRSAWTGLTASLMLARTGQPRRSRLYDYVGQWRLLGLARRRAA